MLFAPNLRILFAGKPSRSNNATSSTDAPSLNWEKPASRTSRRTVQHNLTLAHGQGRQSNSTATARPDRRDNSSVTVLRWRTPEVARANLADGAGAAEAPATAADSHQDRYPVQQASATEHDLPRAIPDATLTTHQRSRSEPGRREGESAVENTTTPASLDIEPAHNLVAQTPTAARTAKTTWQNDPPPKPPVTEKPSPEAAEPSAPSELPEPSELEIDELEETQESEPCQRVYNRRDCCEEEDECQEAKEKWQRAAISKISLDITPNMYPDEKDPVTRETDRNKKLSRSASRTWHDRQGHVVAEGRLSNIERNHVLILNPENEIVRVPFNKLSEDDLCFVTAWWHLPTECTLGDEPHGGRNWAPSTLTWKASGACNNPLYFEERELERYGHTAGPFKQPFVSGATFIGKLLTAPYQSGIHPPWECRYDLGYYRPGSCAPWLVPPLPLSVRGALSEAGAIVGGVNIIP